MSMAVVASNINPVNYAINKSLRFRSSASAYLNRTPASAGNRRTFTWSGWVKRGTLGAGEIFTAGVFSSDNYGAFFFNSSTNQLQLNIIVGGSGAIIAQTPAVFRDASAWYHFVWQS